MMKNAILACATVAVLLSVGCTSTQRIAQSNGSLEAKYFGELGITGHVNTVRVQSGSKLDKLSIIGDGNKVFVDEHVILAKIEIWGGSNEVSIPNSLIVREYIVGMGSTIVRREPVIPSLAPQPALEEIYAPGGTPAPAARQPEPAAGADPDEVYIGNEGE